MKNLVIKGHATRGKEVIEILEMLGGRNKYLLCGESESYFFFIQDGIINCDGVRYVDDHTIYTIEEFLEKFPYKVGDRVLYTTYGIYSRIKSMLWNEEKERVIYRLDSNKLFVATADELQPYKEETNAQCCNIMNHLIDKETMEEQIKIDIPKGYEFAGVDDDKKQVVFTKIGYHYPKTYEECCDIIEYPHNVVGGYKAELLSSFQNLLICRDVYWKIAGAQMGLGEPWKPDWLNTEQDKFVLYTHDNVICLNRFVLGHNVLAFPTAEMRDAFLENFKKLIEHVKELL